MLRIIAKRCTQILLAQRVIPENQERIYIYGFELFLSTFFCVGTMIAAGALFGHLSEVVVFLLFFMPVRMTAGGYHARSYGSCFVLTNGVAAGCIIAAELLWKYSMVWMDVLIWITVAGAILYIWKTAPVNQGIYKQDIGRIQKNRTYSHWILIAEAALILTGTVFADSNMTYTAIAATCAVALMMMV